jgi:hypothetical protein
MGCSDRKESGTQIGGVMQGRQIRLPQDMIDRIEALIPKLERDPRIAAKGRVTFALTLRIALQRGLEDLEREYP